MLKILMFLARWIKRIIDDSYELADDERKRNYRP